MTISLNGIAQTTLTKSEKSLRVDSLFISEGMKKTRTTQVITGNINTEIKYTDANANSVIIQNSGPRGGWGFTDDTGIRFGYRIFWTRIINEANTPLELTINFPADSFALPEPDAYMKVFLHPNGVTQGPKATFDGDKVLEYSKKLFEDSTSLKSLCHTATTLNKIINANESCLFYTVVLRHHRRDINGPRAGYALKEKGLYYKITEFGAELIPCGQIVFK